MKLPYFALRDHIQSGGLRGSNDLFNMFYVGFAWGVATLLAVGGPDRWQGEAFTYARQIPESPYSWAGVLAVCATVLCVGTLLPDEDDPDRLTIRGYLIVSGALGVVAWMGFYAWCLWKAGQAYPTQVGPLGPYQWLTWAFLYMIKVGQHLELKFITRPRQRESTQ